MRKNILKQKGFSLLEIILSLAILTILATVYTINLLDNEMNIFSNTKRNTAIVLAESSMEAIYNINNNSFNNLTDGDYGLSENGNQIALIAGSDTISINNDKNVYVRTISIKTINIKQKEIKINISWEGHNGRINNINSLFYISDKKV